MQPNSVKGTFLVAATLCLVCSLLVSATAVGLRPLQKRNQQLKLRKNVLIAAGLWQDDFTDADVDRLFESVDTVLVNLPGRTEDAPEAGTLNQELDPATYDQTKASKQPASSVKIPEDQDIAKIRRREMVSAVYVVRGEDGAVEKLVLPVYGKGLWSTLYGFLALDADLKTIRGITFYKHGETPGLGGEVDNPAWKAQWDGKVAFDAQGRPQIDVVKGSVAPSDPDRDAKVDGLSGATITSKGVEGLVQYWLGDDGFGPFLSRLRDGELQLTARMRTLRALEAG